MKTIHVVAAIIKRGDEIFATQRGYGDYKDWWEFPGGKIEPGETPEEALIREIREELATEITVDKFITTVEYDYPEFHLVMDCFWCSVKEGHLTLLEHEAAKWLPLDDLKQVKWLPADVEVIDAMEKSYKDKTFSEANKDDLVWYVAYGSNMNYERFMHYIKGGSFKGGGACHEPCSDLSEPRAVINFEIPYNVYFRNSAKAWGNKGVAFLDINKPGSALGVAYLVTREQFRHISCQENNGTPPEESIEWYNATPSLGYYDGYEAFTLSNYRTDNYNDPSDAYLETIRVGIRNNYPEMSEEDIDRYFDRCKKNR